MLIYEKHCLFVYQLALLYHELFIQYHYYSRYLAQLKFTNNIQVKYMLHCISSRLYSIEQSITIGSLYITIYKNIIYYYKLQLAITLN